MKNVISKYFPSRENHRPTKLCPHRFCRAVHGLFTLGGLPLMASLLFHASIWFLVFLALLGVLMAGVERGVWKRSKTDLAMDDRIRRTGAGGRATVVKPDGSDAEPIKLGGNSGNLIVRRGWARAALACDLVVLWAVASSVAHLTDLDMTVPAGSDSDLVGLGAVLGFFAFSALAHRKATELARPVRLPVVVRGEAS